MPMTRAFKSGNSQAVRIPAELAFEDLDVELSISRHGDVIMIEPARPTLRDMVEALQVDAGASGSRSSRTDRIAGS